MVFMGARHSSGAYAHDAPLEWRAPPNMSASRAIPEAARAGLAQGRGEVGELAQELAGVARVDDLLDAEAFGGAERRAHLVEPGLDRGKMRRWIGRRGELGLVGRLDAALERQGAPVAR